MVSSGSVSPIEKHRLFVDERKTNKAQKEQEKKYTNSTRKLNLPRNSRGLKQNLASTLSRKMVEQDNKEIQVKKPGQDSKPQPFPSKLQTCRTAGGENMNQTTPIVLFMAPVWLQKITQILG
jgi:hypothetical protein